MVHWSHSSSWFIYPATSVIVALNPDTAEQRFFLGHTAPVCALQLAYALTHHGARRIVPQGIQCRIGYDAVWDMVTSPRASKLGPT